MSGSDLKENRNIDYPSITENDWYILAIVFSVFTIVAAAFALWWIFNGIYPDKIAERATIAGMIVTLGGVVTTFCTVAWRGMITTRQADVSIQQIAETRRQIAVTEANNIALSLQKGAEFIGDVDSQSKVSAGIAMLHSVVLSGSRNYAVAAHELIIDYIEQNSSNGHENKIVNYAISAVNSSSEETKILSNRLITFEVRNSINFNVDDLTRWKVFNGSTAVVYRGGVFRHQEMKFGVDTIYFFTDVHFYACNFVSMHGVIYNGCTFLKCSFRNVYEKHLETMKFIDCNFSDAFIYNLSDVPDMRSNGNYYYKDSPPMSMDGNLVDWKRYFIEKCK